MANDGRIPAVPAIKPKIDPDRVDEETNMDEDDPSGGEVMDIDRALKDTGQAPNLKDDEVDTEPVDAPIKHAEDNAADE